MQTKILKSNQTQIAAQILKNGGICAIPTETVYGLAANAFDSTAIKKIFAAKGRPNDNPLIVHIAEKDEILNLVKNIPEKAQKLIDKFWPGPLTIILPKSQLIPKEVSANLESVAIRMPKNLMARKIIKEAGVPLAAPSANLSGKPSPTKFEHVFEDLNRKIDAILDGGECECGLESTVISFIEPTPRLLRPGVITKEQVEKIIGQIEIDFAVTEKTKSQEKVASPGMKYKHYAPNCKVIILEEKKRKFCEYINSQKTASIGALCYKEDLQNLNVFALSFGKKNDTKEQAKNFFTVLRLLDKNPKIELVYARIPEKKGIGLALFNRLIRAAGFEVKSI